MEQESEPGPTALPCIVCRKPLEAIGSMNARNHPNSGLIFRAHGNYGSTVFDPVTLDGRWLEVNICDDCISTAAEEFAVIHGQPAPRPPQPSPLYRSWRASDPEH